MSGGYFEYKQYNINVIADSVEQIIRNNDKEDEYGWKTGFSKKTIAEMKTAIILLKQASIYAQRIDWLISADDGEDSFHERLKDELNK